MQIVTSIMTTVSDRKKKPQKIRFENYFEILHF